MATTRFYLDLRGRAKDGKGSIVITIYHNHTTATVSTGVRVAPNEWDGFRVVKLSGSEALNVRLGKQKTDIDRKIALLSIDDGFEFLTASQLKRLVENKRGPAKKPPLSMGEIFADYMSTGMKEGTKEIYRTTLKKIQSYDNDANISDVNLKWLRGFNNYLARTQGVNGRAIYLRSLRAVCNYALHIKAISNYPFENFKIRHEPTRKRSVSVERFREFLNYPVPKHLERYRDYFLLMFFLIGINSKDLLLAKRSNVVNGRFEYVRNKTGKQYSIKLEPEALALLEKYKGKNYLLDAMDTCKHYKSFAHDMNDALKEVGKVEWQMIPQSDDLFAPPKLSKVVQPVIQNITTYYARHCWATFAYEIGVSIDIIAQALGHSTENRTTMIYVKYDKLKVDAANRAVINYVLYGTT